MGCGKLQSPHTLRLPARRRAAKRQQAQRSKQSAASNSLSPPIVQSPHAMATTQSINDNISSWAFEEHMRADLLSVLVGRSLWLRANRSWAQRNGHSGVTLSGPANCLPQCLPQRVFWLRSGREIFNKSLRHRRKRNSPPIVVRSTPESGHVQCNTPCPLCANSGHCQLYSITSSARSKVDAGITRRGCQGSGVRCLSHRRPFLGAMRVG